MITIEYLCNSKKKIFTLETWYTLFSFPQFALSYHSFFNFLPHCSNLLVSHCLTFESNGFSPLNLILC